MNERMHANYTEDKAPSPVGDTQMKQKGTLPSRILRSTGKENTQGQRAIGFGKERDDTQLKEIKAGHEQEVAFKLKDERWVFWYFGIFQFIQCSLCPAQLDKLDI